MKTQNKLCKKCAGGDLTLSGVCRPCRKQYDLLYRHENHDRRLSQAVEWSANNPEKVKAAKAKYRAANPEKTKAAVAASVALNPKKYKEKRESYRASNHDAYLTYKHNRRAKESASGILSKDLAVRLIALQKGKCPCCKLPLGKSYHLDHKMPIALGGSNTDDNIQLLRPRCNAQKHAKHPVDFMQSRGFLL